MSNEVSMIPMSALEAAQARHASVVKMLIVSWMVSVIVLAFALICCLSYSEEATEEIVTTTTEVAQDADNSGSNYFSNGDLLNGSQADRQADGNEDN